jgi:ubiquinone/menaquinone biosynthesis C-methylase UbiE
VTNHIYSKGYHNLTGVDASKNMLSRARLSLKDIIFHYSDITSMPFKDSVFNGALLIGVLSSIPDFQQRIRAISETLRILKSDGVLLFRDFGVTMKPTYYLRYSKFSFFRDKTISPFQWGDFKSKEGIIFHHFNERELKLLFKNLQIEYFKKCQYRTTHGHEIKGFDIIIRKTNKSL